MNLRKIVTNVYILYSNMEDGVELECLSDIFVMPVEEADNSLSLTEM